MTTNTTNDAPPEQFEYVGFGPRFLAAILDSLLLMAITAPVLTQLYGSIFPSLEETQELTFLQGVFYVRGLGDVLVNWVFPAILAIALWRWICATPGKLVLRMAVVDAKTGRRASLLQYTLRYLGYFVSMIPLFLGYFAVLWDKRKQAWHDKIAGTVVIVNEDRKTDF